jgi:hypothetical protein
MKTSTVYSIAGALDYHNFYREGFGSVSTVYDYGQLCWDIWELNSVDRDFTYLFICRRIQLSQLLL